jgi:hypothetical protein
MHVEIADGSAGPASAGSGDDDSDYVDYKDDDGTLAAESETLFDEGEGADLRKPSSGFFTDMPRSRGGVILPYALSIPEAHVESFVQQRNKVMRQATAKEGGEDPLSDDTSTMFFPNTGYSRCYLWSDDMPRLGLLPYTLDIVGPFIRARNGGTTSIGTWDRLTAPSAEDSSSDKPKSAEERALRIKGSHTYFRASQPAEGGGSAVMVIEPEMIITAYDQVRWRKAGRRVRWLCYGRHRVSNATCVSMLTCTRALASLGACISDVSRAGARAWPRRVARRLCECRRPRTRVTLVRATRRLRRVPHRCMVCLRARSRGTATRRTTTW